MLKVNIYSSNLFFVKAAKKFFVIKNIFSDKPVTKSFKNYCKNYSIYFK